MRLEFVKQALNADSNMSLLCKRYGISRKTGYKWLKRYESIGLSGLDDQSRKPHHLVNLPSEALTQQVLSLKDQYPYWGARKLHALLQSQGISGLPISGIHRLLERTGRVTKRGKNKSSYLRYEHEHPNDLWQMDFKGHIPYGSGRCHPLTIIDDYSRFLVALKASPNEKGQTIRPWLIESFRRYGLPCRINVDNGAPWGSLYECARYTTFSLWLIDHGVRVSYSRPRHPQTNGKDERLHRTLKEELLSYQSFISLQAAQKAFDQWREQYNCIRPHHALDYKTPNTRYRPSEREYSEQVKEYEYAEDYVLFKVDTRGRIRVQNRMIFVGIPFSGRYIGTRKTDHEHQIDIYYRQQKIGHACLDQIPKNGMINLYNKRLLVT